MIKKINENLLANKLDIEIFIFSMHPIVRELHNTQIAIQSNSNESI